MRKLLLLTLMTIAITACATNDRPPYDAPERGRGRSPRDFGDGRRAAPAELGLPAAWWRDPGFAEPLALSSDQFQRLDALSGEQDEVDRLERDGMLAMRDLQAAIGARNVTAAEIVEAGKRVREMRDALLGRQITLLASQREILTQPQWQALQDELANERRERTGDRMRGRGMGGREGGRGGRGGGFGGRRPGGVW